MLLSSLLEPSEVSLPSPGDATPKKKCVSGRRPGRRSEVPQLNVLTVRPGNDLDITSKKPEIKIVVKPEDGDACTTEFIDVSPLKEEEVTMTP